MKVMLDTDICIHIIRKKDNAILRRFYKYNPYEIGISSVTLSELEYGTYKSTQMERNQIALMQFVSLLEILSFDDKAAAEYGRIRAFLEKQGTPIGSFDTLIAAHAYSLNCKLVSNNIKEFSRIPGLKLLNGLEF